MFKIYCDVLQLSDIPTLENLKSTYRKLIFVWHPDKFHHDESQQKKATIRAQKRVMSSYVNK